MEFIQDFRSSIMASLVQKLGIKPGFRLLVENGPAEVINQINEIDRLQWNPQGELDYIHIFVSETSVLIELLQDTVERVAPKGMLWVSWPKKASGMQSDLNREIVREIVLTTELVDIKVCSVDDTWSALKFVHRRKK